jgi:hypothetical protein
VRASLDGDWGKAAFDHLCEAGLPHSIVELGREGYRRTGELLAPFVALLAGETRGKATTVSDQLPPEVMIGDMPGWALDMFTREGRAASVMARPSNVHVPLTIIWTSAQQKISLIHIGSCAVLRPRAISFAAPAPTGTAALRRS